MKIIEIDWQDTIPIRHRVLSPDKSPEYSIVEGDPEALHYGAFIDAKLVCVASIHKDKRSARLRKFATLPEYQGQGVGSKMVKHIVNTLKDAGIELLWFDARETAISFYRRFGFEVFGERFYKGDVPHFKMQSRF